MFCLLLDSSVLLIIRYETATGKRTVLVAAAALTLPNTNAPLTISDYRWSDDGQTAAAFSPTRKKVWRELPRRLLGAQSANGAG